jgi:hypothetical protein
MESVRSLQENQNRPIVERLLAASGVAALAGGSGVVAYFDPSTTHLFPVCPLFAMTGLACPGCGLTRGFHALFHGDILTALHFNALIPVWAMIFVWVVISLSFFAARGRWLPMWPTHPRFLSVFVTVLMTFGVLRNLPFFPFTTLYP